jgi:hypothetical protein
MSLSGRRNACDESERQSKEAAVVCSDVLYMILPGGPEEKYESLVKHLRAEIRNRDVLITVQDC